MNCTARNVKKAVKKNKKMVALRMNPESKKPSPELPDGDEKFRLMVMGHRDPEDWETDPQDAPVIGDVTFRQLIAAGTDGPDGAVQARVADKKFKPAYRKQRQLWEKSLVIDQEKSEAQQAAEGAVQGAVNSSKSPTGQAGQDSSGTGKTNPSDCA